MKRVLFLCTQNSARSRMAEGLAGPFLAGRIAVYVAGVAPVRVNLYAIRVMQAMGIDISGQRPKSVKEFAGRTLDDVISLCSVAAQWSVYLGPGQRLHRDALRQELISWRERRFAAAAEPEKAA